MANKDNTIQYNTIQEQKLRFGKELRISYEQSQACCPAEHKNKVSKLAISKVMTEHQNRAWLSLILYCI